MEHVLGSASKPDEEHRFPCVPTDGRERGNPLKVSVVNTFLQVEVDDLGIPEPTPLAASKSSPPATSMRLGSSHVEDTTSVAPTDEARQTSKSGLVDEEAQHTAYGYNSVSDGVTVSVVNTFLQVDDIPTPMPLAASQSTPVTTSMQPELSSPDELVSAASDFALGKARCDIGSGGNSASALYAAAQPRTPSSSLTKNISWNSGESMKVSVVNTFLQADMDDMGFPTPMSLVASKSAPPTSAMEPRKVSILGVPGCRDQIPATDPVGVTTAAPSVSAKAVQSTYPHAVAKLEIDPHGRPGAVVTDGTKPTTRDTSTRNAKLSTRPRKEPPANSTGPQGTQLPTIPSWYGYGAPIPLFREYTAMIKNIPNNITQKSFLKILNDHCSPGSYNFVYLPMDFRTGKCKGYAFVNICLPDYCYDYGVTYFFHTFNQFQRWGVKSTKAAEVHWGGERQGFQANVAHFKYSSVMHPKVPLEYKPVCFCRGEIIDFPDEIGDVEIPEDLSDMFREPTTLLIKNFEKSMTRDKLVEFLDEHGSRGKYDLLYLPINFDDNSCKQYAFVNFTAHSCAEGLRRKLEAQIGSRIKACWCNVQGRDLHIERLRNSEVNHAELPDRFKPMMFLDGVPCSFPAPTKTDLEYPSDLLH